MGILMIKFIIETKSKQLESDSKKIRYSFRHSIESIVSYLVNICIYRLIVKRNSTLITPKFKNKDKTLNSSTRYRGKKAM